MLVNLGLAVLPSKHLRHLTPPSLSKVTKITFTYYVQLMHLIVVLEHLFKLQQSSLAVLVLLLPQLCIHQQGTQHLGTQQQHCFGAPQRVVAVVRLRFVGLACSSLQCN